VPELFANLASEILAATKLSLVTRCTIAARPPWHTLELDLELEHRG
jgi:hypothetical protein